MCATSAGQAVDLLPARPYAARPMRAAVGVAVVLGTLAGAARPAAADIYLLRDRKGVLHITNTPVDPGTQLIVRQPPRVIASRGAHHRADGAPARLAVRGTASPPGGAHADGHRARDAVAVRRDDPRDCRSLRRGVCAGEGGDQGGVGIQSPGRLAKGSAGAHAAHAGYRGGGPGAGRLHAAGQHRGRREATCVACSIATTATSRSPWPPTTRDPCGSTRWAASRTSPRPASTSPVSSATGSGISGRARVSARPVADAAARAGSSCVVALPNLLSLLRIGLVPVLVVVLFWSGPLARALAGCALPRRLHHRLLRRLAGAASRRHHARTVPRSARRQAHRRRGADHAGRDAARSRACPRGWRW